jgi:hypothetical protein
MFKKLNSIKNYTFEKLKTDLKNYIPQIKKLLNSDDQFKSLMQNAMLDYDDFIEIILKLAFINLNNWKMDRLEDRMQLNPFAMILNLVSKEDIKDRERFIQSYQDKLMRFGDDYAAFYTFEINKMAKTADKIIRKIAKLYSNCQRRNQRSKEMYS